MLHSVFFALMVGSDANWGTGQGGTSPASSLQRLENALSKSSSARSRRLAARTSKISTLLSFF